MATEALGPGDGLDSIAALARVGGDADLLKEIARVFRDDCPRAVAELRDAAARGDCVLVERAAHGLKGASSNFGAASVVSAASHIEQMGRAGVLDGFTHAFHQLETALAALLEQLEALIAS